MLWCIPNEDGDDDEWTKYDWSSLPQLWWCWWWYLRMMVVLVVVVNIIMTTKISEFFRKMRVVLPRNGAATRGLLESYRWKIIQISHHTSLSIIIDSSITFNYHQHNPNHHHRHQSRSPQIDEGRVCCCYSALSIRAQWDRCWGPKSSKIETSHLFSIVKLFFCFQNKPKNPQNWNMAKIAPKSDKFTK